MANSQATFTARFVIHAIQRSTSAAFSKDGPVFFLEVLMSGTLHMRSKGVTVKGKSFFGTVPSDCTGKALAYANKLLAGKWLTDDEYDDLYTLIFSIDAPLRRASDGSVGSEFAHLFSVGNL